MLAQRLKQLRLARGLSLDDLAQALGGLVTKQALSKYEKELSQPSVKVTAKIAEVFGVKTAQLFTEPTVHVALQGYRKCASLPKRDEKMIEGLVPLALEERIRLQERIGELAELNLPLKKFKVASFDDAEQAAMELRKVWELGTGPIASVVGLLEDQFIHVFAVSTSSAKFDGTSALATDDEGKVKAAAVVYCEGVSGERQRFSLMHEVAHLVLDVAEGLDEEKIAHRFAGAFLAPAELLKREIGTQRSTVQFAELLILKKRFGMSLQALAFRLKDLAIITDASYKWLCIQFNRHQMRRTEPGALPLEEPQWLKRTVLRGLSEGLLTPEEAGRLTGESYESARQDFIDRRAFMKLSPAERRLILEEQAVNFMDYYADEVKDLGGGEFVDNE